MAERVKEKMISHGVDIVLWAGFLQGIAEVD
jgi:hypothetical protein